MEWWLQSVCFVSSGRRHTVGALVTGVQTCDRPISRGCTPPRRPWLEMLDPESTWDDLERVAESAAVPIPYAIDDDPDRQRRVALGWDPVAGNIGLFGMVGSGVTKIGRASCRERVCPYV